MLHSDCHVSDNLMHSKVLPQEHFQPKLSSHDYERLSTWYDKHSNSLLGIILQLTTNQKEAEKILHQSFLTMARSESFFEPENDVRRFACMTAIVLQQCGLCLALTNQYIMTKTLGIFTRDTYPNNK